MIWYQNQTGIKVNMLQEKLTFNREEVVVAELLPDGLLPALLFSLV